MEALSKEALAFQVKGWQLNLDISAKIWEEDKWHRSFAYNINDGCWVVGEEDKTNALIVPDTYQRVIAIDKECLANWTV